MGLDMYLEARKYVQRVDWASVNRDKEYDEYPVTPEYALLRGFFPEGADKYGDIAGGEVKVTAGYWRKVNHIHDWFVRNVQDGVDKCEPHHVSHAVLEDLLEVCKAVVAQPAMSSTYLPTASGFFFGGTEYDEYYFESTKRTIEMIEHVLATFPEDTYELYYQSSW